MDSNSLRLLLSLLASLLLLPTTTAQNSLVPGSYVMTMKYLSPANVYCTRLEMYSFQPNGYMRSDGWVFCADSFMGYGDGQNIGRSSQPNVPEEGNQICITLIEIYLYSMI